MLLASFTGISFADTVPEFAAGSITTFTPGTLISSTEMNENFSAVSEALTQIGSITNLVNGNIDSSNVKDDSVDGADILNGTIQGIDIEDGSIAGADIQDGSIQGADIQDGTIQGIDIEDGSIAGTDIQDGSIQGADIQDGSIEEADIQDGSVGSNLLAVDDASLSKVSGSAMSSINGRIYANRMRVGALDNERQLTGGPHGWIDISSSGSGYGLVASNAYLGHSSNECMYANDHSGIGAAGIAFNRPIGCVSIFTGLGETFAGQTFDPAYRMTIGESGNVGLGVEPTDADLDIQGDVETTIESFEPLLRFLDKSDVAIAQFYRDYKNSTEYLGLECPNGKPLILQEWSGYVGVGTTNPSVKLEVNGEIKCLGLDETSDLRFKRDITPLYDPLKRITMLRGVSFNWRWDEFEEISFTQEREIGLIAQEVEQVIPEVVHTDDEGYKSIEYTKIVPILIEAVKELKTRNDELLCRIEKLEAGE